jgi:hypothetical protein
MRLAGQLKVSYNQGITRHNATELRRKALTRTVKSDTSIGKASMIISPYSRIDEAGGVFNAIVQ